MPRPYRPLLIIEADQRAPAGPLLPQMVAWLMAWTAFAWPWLAGHVTIPWDAKAHFLPQVQFLAASIAKGEWPFWAPQVFAGQLQIADPQSMMFSPTMLALALLNPAPGLTAVDTALFLSLLASGAGVILLTREWRWHPAAQVIAAIGFCFGAAMAWRLQHYGQGLSMAWLPFTLLALERALVRRSLAWGFASGVMAAFIALGRDQISLLCLYLLAGFVVAHWLQGEGEQRIRRSLPPLLAGGVGGALVCAVPVLMTLVLAGQSNRPIITYEGAGAGSLHPGLLITALAPHLYGAAGPMELYWGPPSFTWTGTGLYIAQNVGELYIGAIPFLLLLAAAARGVLWERDVRYLTLAFLVVSLYALGWYTPAFRAFYEFLPGVDLYRRPADAVFLMGGFGALLAGYAAHRLLSGTLPAPTPLSRIIEAGVLAGSLAFAIGIGVYWGRLDRVWEPLGYAALSLAVSGLALAAARWLSPIRPIAAAGVLIAVLAADIAWNNGPNGASGLPLSYVDVLQPDTRNETIAFLKARTAEGRAAGRRDRVELIGLGFHWPNASLTHDLDNTLGYNPVRLKWYGDAVGAEDSSGMFSERPHTPLVPTYAAPFARLLGIRWIASGTPIEKLDPALPASTLRLAARTTDGYIYENPTALPRALFATRALPADFAEITRKGWPARVDPADTVLLEAAPATVASPKRPGTARIHAYTNTAVEIEADSPDGGWVVLNDVWHPWWRAAIDGLPAPLLRANVAFRAVEVPPGRHRVAFTLAPVSGLVRSVTAGVSP